MFPELTETQVELVVDSVKESLAAGALCESRADQ